MTTPAHKTYEEICDMLDQYQLGRLSMYHALHKDMTLYEFISEHIDHPRKDKIFALIEPFYARDDYSIDKVAAGV
jgi:hypothetical protein